LNDELRAAGKQEANLILADEHLEDEDLLQMVNAGLLPIVIVDSSKADFWVQIFDNLELHPDLAVRTGGEIAWAFRKDSPQLAAEVNAFIRANRKGTLMGNILFKRYLKDTKWVTHALSSTEIAKFNASIDLFRTYGEQYDFDHLMLAALGYQESRLDQSVRSGAGAVGVMQLLRSTASDPNVGITNIDEIEPNIHAGTKYLRFLRDRYFKDAPMSDVNKTLFSFASYNAGPARVRGLRAKAEAAGLDPNVWFGNVEVIASREIGRETVQYVSNIYKYYIAYRQAELQRERKEQALVSD
jgi:membrane-bound lytic murein transglycosylase MltF